MHYQYYSFNDTLCFHMCFFLFQNWFIRVCVSFNAYFSFYKLQNQTFFPREFLWSIAKWYKKKEEELHVNIFFYSDGNGFASYCAIYYIDETDEIVVQLKAGVCFHELTVTKTKHTLIITECNLMYSFSYNTAHICTIQQTHIDADIDEITVNRAN